MLCFCCKDKEVAAAKRPLCGSCYREARIDGTLHQYPLINSNEDSETTKNNIRLKYGEEILFDLERLVAEYSLTLQSLGDKYNLTRERIRQLFKLVYGYSYTNVLRKKRNDHKIEERIKLKDPREQVKRYHHSALLKGVQSEAIVLEICQKLGYVVSPYRNQTCDLVINGIPCDVKSAHKLANTAKKGTNSEVRYYHFSITKNQKRDATYIICHAVPKNEFYVIPREYISARQIYIRAFDTANTQGSGRFARWKGAWHLLNQQLPAYRVAS
jgi:hypothetical protein